MKTGVLIFPTDKSIQPIELARACEERGFGSLWFPEHSHIPSSRVTPWGGMKNMPPLPEEYWRSHDQFVALTAAAAVTTKLKVGTGITLVAQRDPFWLAKETASLDMISGGRFIFGIGYGWNLEEMEHHGVPTKRRRAFVREKMLAVKERWSKDEASFHGEYVNFESSWAWPKPVQQPHLPVVIGGAGGPLLFRHVAEYGDGWLPIGGRGVRDALPQLHRAAEEAGRDPAELVVIPFGTVPSQGKLEHYASMGITEVVLQLPSAPEDVVLEAIDAHMDFLGSV